MPAGKGKGGQNTESDAVVDASLGNEMGTQPTGESEGKRGGGVDSGQDEENPEHEEGSMTEAHK